MAAILGASPGSLVHSLHNRTHARRGVLCDSTLSVFDSPTLPPRFSNTQSGFFLKNTHISLHMGSE